MNRDQWALESARQTQTPCRCGHVPARVIGIPFIGVDLSSSCLNLALHIDYQPRRAA